MRWLLLCLRDNDVAVVSCLGAFSLPCAGQGLVIFSVFRLFLVLSLCNSFLLCIREFACVVVSGFGVLCFFIMPVMVVVVSWFCLVVVLFRASVLLNLRGFACDGFSGVDVRRSC